MKKRTFIRTVRHAVYTDQKYVVVNNTILATKADKSHLYPGEKVKVIIRAGEKPIVKAIKAEEPIEETHWS